jgi:AraC family transcriptional regulator
MRADTLSSHQQRILDAQVYLESHLDSRVSVTALAQRGHYSLFHFLHVFRALVGESPGEYQRRLRIERAAHALKSSQERIVRIAAKAGFRSHAAFTKAFTTRYEISPTAFRRVQPRRAKAKASGSDPRRLRVERLPNHRVAFIRYRGAYAEVPPVFDRLREWVGHLQRQQPLFIGLAHDDPGVTPAGQVRFDCGVIVDSSVRGEGPIGIQEVPAGEYAVATHRGSFASLGRTYGWIGRIGIPALGRDLRMGPAVELYLTDPVRTPERDRLTDILLPLE